VGWWVAAPGEHVYVPENPTPLRGPFAEDQVVVCHSNTISISPKGYSSTSIEIQAQPTHVRKAS